MHTHTRRYTISFISGEIRRILVTCLASIGAVSNSQHQLQVSGNAGRSRWKGRRPNVRATVKNPVDHPMGGGEGKHSGGLPRNKNGVPAKGFKTRISWPFGWHPFHYALA